MDRKDLRYGKRMFILADLQNGSVMAKYFTEHKISLNFTRGQELTTYAYETNKLMKDKIMAINFVHITKQEFNANSRTYHSFPRLVTFYEQDTVKTMGQKIFLGIRSTIN